MSPFYFLTWSRLHRTSYACYCRKISRFERISTLMSKVNFICAEISRYEFVTTWHDSFSGFSLESTCVAWRCWSLFLHWNWGGIETTTDHAALLLAEALCCVINTRWKTEFNPSGQPRTKTETGTQFSDFRAEEEMETESTTIKLETHALARVLGYWLWFCYNSVHLKITFVKSTIMTISVSESVSRRTLFMTCEGYLGPLLSRCFPFQEWSDCPLSTTALNILH